RDGEGHARGRVLEQLAEERLELVIGEELIARLVLRCESDGQDLSGVALPDAAPLGQLQRRAQGDELFRDGVVRHMPARSRRLENISSSNTGSRGGTDHSLRRCVM